MKVLKRSVIITLLLLTLLSAGGAYLLYDYLIPLKETKEAEVSKVQAEIEAKRAEVAKLKEEFILLQIQLRKFKELEAKGFFNNQNRVKAKESFAELGVLAGVLNTRYQIDSGILTDVRQASEANSVIVKSPVTLNIDSLDDVDVMTFIKGLQEKFPGSVDFTAVELERTEDLDADVLKKIGRGDPIIMVRAKITFDWRTMANRDRLMETDTSAAASPDMPPVLASEPSVSEGEAAPLPVPAAQAPAQPASVGGAP